MKDYLREELQTVRLITLQRVGTRKVHQFSAKSLGVAASTPPSTAGELKRYRVMAYITPLARDWRAAYIKAISANDALDRFLEMWNVDRNRCGDYQVLLSNAAGEFRVLVKNAPMWDRIGIPDGAPITILPKQQPKPKDEGPKPKKDKHALRRVIRTKDHVITGTLALLSAERKLAVKGVTVVRTK